MLLLLFSCFALTTSIVGAMAELFICPIKKKIIDTCSALTTSIVGAMAGLVEGLIKDIIINACSDYFKDYLKDQFRGQTGIKEELKRLLENQAKIQALVHFACSQKQIKHQNLALNEWLWLLRDAIEDVDKVLDELEYMKLEKQLTKNKKLRKVRSMMKSKRLEEAVQKLDEVSADVTTFLHLLDTAKQERKEQEVDFYQTRETGPLPTTNDLIGRGEAMEYVTQWLKKLSNEHRDRNISILSIVGHGGMGKTTLLQHVYQDDEMTKEFDLKMWVCVSNNFDAKKVIAVMLESIDKKKPDLDSLDALQGRLKNEVMSKRFLLVLDDVWEEQDISKWENVLAPLASGGFGSKIVITTRMESVSLMFAKAIKKKRETVKLAGLEEDECFQLLNSHAFAGVESPPDDHENLRVIARDIVKKLSGSPLEAKVVGGILNANLDERHWKKFLESNLRGHNSINSILRRANIFLPNPLRHELASKIFAREECAKLSETIRRLSVYLLKYDLIGRRNYKELVMQWVRKPSNEPRTTRYRNKSLLSIVGHGGMGKNSLHNLFESARDYIYLFI